MTGMEHTALSKEVQETLLDALATGSRRSGVDLAELAERLGVPLARLEGETAAALFDLELLERALADLNLVLTVAVHPPDWLAKVSFD